MRAGYLAEVDGPEALVAAAHALRLRGYRRLDAFTPYLVKGLEEALGARRSWLAKAVFPMAMLGAGLGVLVQWWCNAVDYPINVGGRPLVSWPAYVPITFEAGVLTAGLSGLLIFLLASRLPELHCPLFDADGFDSASIDAFWIGVDERDPMWNEVGVAQDLREIGAIRVVRARRRSP